MTEADLLSLIWRHLAGGQVYPYVVPLLAGMAVGGASVGGFQPDFMRVGGRDGRGQAESSGVGADRRLCRDCDAGASDTSGRP